MRRALLLFAAVLALFICCQNPIAAPLFRGSGISAPVTPASFSGLAVWLQGGVGLTCTSGCTSGHAVTQWADQSGNACNASGGTSPTYLPSALNGIGGVNFNGSTQYLTLCDLSEPMEVVAVEFPTCGQGIVTNYVTVLGADVTSGSIYGAYDFGENLQFLPGAITTAWGGAAYERNTTNDGGSLPPNTLVVASSHSLGIWSVLGFTNDGAGTVGLTKWGTQVITQTLGSGSERGIKTGTTTLGGGWKSGALNSPFCGVIEEFIAYNRVLTSGERASLVANYINPRYGFAPSGNYLLTSFARSLPGNSAGAFTDQSLYTLQGTDGINFTQTVPSDLPLSIGQYISNPNVLHDGNGVVATVSGNYVMSYNNIVFNPQTWPNVTFNIDVSATLSPNLSQWSRSFVYNCDTSGITDGTSSGRGCFADGWFIDHSGVVHQLISASNTFQLGTNQLLYEIHPSTPGVLTAWSTPVQITGTDVSSNDPQNAVIIDDTQVSGNCYLFYKNNSAVLILRAISTTAGCLSGYGSSTTLFTNYEGPQIVNLSGNAASGNWRLYLDSSLYGNSGQYYADSTTGLGGTFGSATSINGPSVNGNGIMIQGASVVRLQ